MGKDKLELILKVIEEQRVKAQGALKCVMDRPDAGAKEGASG